MWLPKAPASVDPADALDAQPVHQQPGAGVERRLGELDGADVVLRDADLGLARVQQVAEGAARRRGRAGCARPCAPSTTPSG